ncbi:hypothetical protein P3S68_000392 [Capsicum galapagoense]
MVNDDLSVEHMSQELHPVLECEKKDTSLVAGDILFQVSKKHYLIMATPGGVLDRAIDAEDSQHNDFFRLT